MFNLSRKNPKSVIGIDISKNSIKIVELGAALKNFIVKDIPKEEKDSDGAIADILRQYFKKVNQKETAVYSCLFGAGLSCRRITLPKMGGAELREAIKWEIKKNIPYPIESVSLDYTVLESFPEKDLEKLSIFVVAAQKELLRKHLSIFEKAGISLAGITFIPFALWECIRTKSQFSADETIAVVDIEDDTTYINIFKNNILQLTREITVGGENLANIPIEENSENTLLRRFTAELNRSLDYFKEAFHEPKIDRIILTGDYSASKNLDIFLGSSVGTRAEIFDNGKSARITKAWGAALAQAKYVNLIRQKESIFKLNLPKISISSSAGLAAGVFALIIALGAYFALDRMQKNLKSEADKQKAALSDIKLKETLSSTLKRLQTETIKTSYVLNEAGKIIPNNVLLEKLEFSFDSKRIIVEGNAQNISNVAKTVKKIEDSAFFKTTTLIETSKSGEGAQKMNFKISFNLE